jgi:hypothetical protein
VRDRRRSSTGEGEPERRQGERREPVEDTQERRRESDREVVPLAPTAEPADVKPPKQTSPPAAPQAARSQAPLIIVSRTS